MVPAGLVHSPCAEIAPFEGSPQCIKRIIHSIVAASPRRHMAQGSYYVSLANLTGVGRFPPSRCHRCKPCLKTVSPLLPSAHGTGLAGLAESSPASQTLALHQFGHSHYDLPVLFAYGRALSLQLPVLLLDYQAKPLNRILLFLLACLTISDPCASSRLCFCTGLSLSSTTFLTTFASIFYLPSFDGIIHIPPLYLSSIWMLNFPVRNA